MIKFLIVPLVFCFTYLHAQERIVPAEANSFVLPGYETLDYVPGDLNGDKRKDAILVLKLVGEDSMMEEETPRPLIILIRGTNGKLSRLLQNDNAVMCRHCGGSFGDPYTETTIQGMGFTLSFYGGSSWRWGYDYRFLYKPLKKNFYLVKEKQVSFQSGDPEATMKETVIPETELGEIAIDRFSSDPVYEDSHWKVRALKTFFYDSPVMGSKPRKGYLLKGNEVTGIRHLKNFIEVSFENQAQKITTGYILKKDLEIMK